MPEPFGYTIFCDDIREELGSKLSYMGRYLGEMLILGTAPLALPKLAAGVNFVLPRPFSGGSLRVVLMMDTAAGQAVLQETSLDHIEDNPANTGDVLIAGTNLVLSPLLLHGDCTLRVRGYLNGAEIKAGSLRIRIVDALPTPASTGLN